MPRLAKGSKEASEQMAHLRSLRKKKGGSIDPPAVPAVSGEEKEGAGIQTPWVKHVADFAHKNNMNYFEALKDPKVKLGYKKK